MKRLIFLMLLFCGVFITISFLSSCKHEPASLSNLPIVCYDTQIQTIFSASCGMAGCHDGGSGSRGEDHGFSASNYASVMRSVKAGDPWRSKVYTIVSSPNNPNMMPPKGHQPLTIEQRTLIEVWILQGAKETKCDTAAIYGTTQNGSQINTQDLAGSTK